VISFADYQKSTICTSRTIIEKNSFVGEVITKTHGLRKELAEWENAVMFTTAQQKILNFDNSTH